MVITKQNPNGGPALRSYQIKEDPDTGILGYHIGYCTCGCQKPLLIRTLDLREVIDKFGWSMEEHRAIMRRLSPKKPWRHRLIIALGGKIGD